MPASSWILQLAGAAVVALALLELACRVRLHRGGYFVWPRYFRRVIILDPETFPQLPGVAAFEGNADGERGLPCPTGHGVRRILAVGGSTVESALNDQPASWPAQAQALLNRPDALAKLRAAYIHVGNVGRSGMDVPAVAYVLEKSLPRYPRLPGIWMMVGPGDLLRWLEEGAPAEAVIQPLDVHRCFGENPEVEFGLHPLRTGIATQLKRLRLTMLRPVERREKAGRWMKRARELRRNAERFITEMPDSTAFLKRFEDDLDAAVRRATAAADQVVLIRQPVFRKASYTPEEDALFWNGGIGNAYDGDDVKVFFSTEVILRLLDLIEQRIARVAEKHGAVFVDTLPRITMSSATFYDHFHLTPKGAKDLASAVAEAVLADDR